jgi:hypothetical protein
MLSCQRNVRAQCVVENEVLREGPGPLECDTPDIRLARPFSSRTIVPVLDFFTHTPFTCLPVSLRFLSQAPTTTSNEALSLLSSSADIPLLRSYVLVRTPFADPRGSVNTAKGARIVTVPFFVLCRVVSHNTWIRTGSSFSRSSEESTRPTETPQSD